MNHVSASPTDGNGPTQGQRKTLTRVGNEPTTYKVKWQSLLVLVRVHCRDYNIFSFHDLLPSDLVAQSVEERLSIRLSISIMILSVPFDLTIIALIFIQRLFILHESKCSRYAITRVPN